MDRFNDDLNVVILKLFDIGALKFGDFKMKVGINSPVYFDMRVMVSEPPLMDKLADLLLQFMGQRGLRPTVLCGVPYTALPVTTMVAVKSGLPMLIRRKEPKSYGTMKLIDGKFTPGDDCLIIEDVVTSGGSILETATDLRKDGLLVEDAVIMVDREQGGVANLVGDGIRTHSLITLSKALHILVENGRLDQKTMDEVKLYTSTNQVHLDEKFPNLSRLNMTFEARAPRAKNPLARRLLSLMAEKRSNLCVAVDLSTWSEVVALVKAVGEFVVVVKTHSDAVTDWDLSRGSELRQLAEQYNFVILEDRKLGDIGNTIQSQCQVAFDWADCLTMHPICGAGAMDGVSAAIEKVGSRRELGIFLVAELSCQGHLITPSYVKRCAEMAESYSSSVIGLVAQNPLLAKDPGFVQLTPGVGSRAGGDHLGQTYVTPAEAVLGKGGDLIVVGRAITSSFDPKGVAREMRDTLWEAYLKRVTNLQSQ